MRKLWLACLALFVAIEGVACGGDSQGPAGPPASTPPASSVASVSVSPGSGTVQEGLSILFLAVARDASGRIVTGVKFQWEISDTAVAEINASGASRESGRVTGKTAGQIQVRAIANGRVGSAQLVVIRSTIASLEIVAPSASLLVNEAVLLRVTARNADGITVRTPMLQWASSDEAIARLGSGARAGVVTALRRGTVTITARAGSLEASVPLSVTARVSIGPGPAVHCDILTVCVAIGDTLQFAASFVDINGATIDEIPSVTWASGDPGVASVSSTGLVIGLRTGLAAITATSSDGVGTMDVAVTGLIAGLPATVRFAHAAPGRGPVTFVPSQGAPVTLAFGESVEVTIVSGTFSVHVDGLGSNGSDQSWAILGGDHLALYGTVNGTAALWINEVSVPAGSGLVRFVQGMDFPSWAAEVLLGAPGAEVAESRLINCYFDPLDSTEYALVPAGEFDVIGGGKGLFSRSGPEIARVRATATSGRAVTYVLTGNSPQTARLLAFPDF